MYWSKVSTGVITGVGGGVDARNCWTPILPFAQSDFELLSCMVSMCVYLSVLQRSQLSCALTFSAGDRELDLFSGCRRAFRGPVRREAVDNSEEEI